MIGLGETMVDVVLGTGQLEAVRPDEFATIEGLADVICRRGDIAGRCEPHPIICQHGVHLVGHRLDHASEEVQALRRVALSCSSTKANFEARSMATNI